MLPVSVTLGVIGVIIVIVSVAALGAAMGLMGVSIALVSVGLRWLFTPTHLGPRLAEGETELIELRRLGVLTNDLIRVTDCRVIVVTEPEPGLFEDESYYYEDLLSFNARLNTAKGLATIILVLRSSDQVIECENFRISKAQKAQQLASAQMIKRRS